MDNELANVVEFDSSQQAVIAYDQVEAVVRAGERQIENLHQKADGGYDAAWLEEHTRKYRSILQAAVSAARGAVSFLGSAAMADAAAELNTDIPEAVQQFLHRADAIEASANELLGEPLYKARMQVELPHVEPAENAPPRGPRGRVDIPIEELFEVLRERKDRTLAVLHLAHKYGCQPRVVWAKAAPVIAELSRNHATKGETAAAVARAKDQFPRLGHGSTSTYLALTSPVTHRPRHIRECLRELDPTCLLRAGSKVVRINYHAPHPLYAIHADAHLKLKFANLYVHGVVDGATNVVLSAQVLPHIRAEGPLAVMETVLRAVHAVPVNARTDHGTENGMSNALLQSCGCAVKGVTSMHNQPAEQAWSKSSTHITRVFKNRVMAWGAGVFDPTSDVDIIALQVAAIPFLQHLFDSYLAVHNNRVHPASREGKTRMELFNEGVQAAVDAGKLAFIGEEDIDARVGAVRAEYAHLMEHANMWWGPAQERAQSWLSVEGLGALFAEFDPLAVTVYSQLQGHYLAVRAATAALAAAAGDDL